MLDVVYCFNGVAWVARSPMPTARQSISAITLSANVALVCGGKNWVSGTPTLHSLCHEYAHAANTWTPAPPLVLARAYASLAWYQGE